MSENNDGVRVGTLVWGGVLTVVGALVLIGQLTDIRFNLALVVLALLIASGLALVAGGLLSLGRTRNPRDRF